MAIFFHKDVRELLQNRKVVVIGDSIQRSVYKDLVCLWTQENSRYLFQRELRAKGELAFLGDKLLSGGKLEGKMVNGIEYREVREFKDGEVLFKYYFVTRSYSEHMVSILNELKTCGPDIIVMNSTFWDLHHYGDNDLQQYKQNLDKLLKDINEMFPSSLLFVWNAALPLAERCKGGFLRKGFLTIPVEKIKTANKLAWLATTEQKKIYLDLFTELKNKDNFTQAEDGIHWGMRAHRKISNLILTEVCTSWNKKLPDPPKPPNRPDNRNSSPVPWSSFYPDNGDSDNWNSPPASSFNNGYELDYLHIVPYWDSPVISPGYDRYQIPSPLLSGGFSPFAYNRMNLNWGYNAPFVTERAREYQSFHTPTPFVFPNQFPPVREMKFNFSTPGGPYYPQKYFFKPAYSHPPPVKSYSPSTRNDFNYLLGRSPGLLPTPSVPQSFAFYNNGSSSYRDRFKKLSNPSVRGRRYKSNAAQNRQSQTPQNSVSDQKASSAPAASSSDLSDHNNNDEQRSSASESCSKPNGDNVVVETGVPPTDKPKSPLRSASPGGSSDNASHVNGEVASNGDDGIQKDKPLEVVTETSETKKKGEDSETATADDKKTSGVKRKHEDDETASVEESNPCKIARNGNPITDASSCGIKRKLEEVEEPVAVKGVHENGLAYNSGDNIEAKRKCTLSDVDAMGTSNPQTVPEESLSQGNTKVKHSETQLARELAVRDVVRCALTYDSFI